MTTARIVAAEVLRRSRDREGFVADVLDRLAGLLSPQDRRLAVQLVNGVVRRRGTLDCLFAAFMTRPLRETHPDTLDLLRLGTFQIAFLTNIPKHAAVHETVEITPPVVKKFVNAILRKVADVVTDEFTGELGPRAVPVSESGRGDYRRLTLPLLPDPKADFAEYLSAAHSWPRWLARRWLDRFGPDECVRLGFWFNSPPPLWLRIDTAKVSRNDYLLHLAAKNIDAEPGDHPQSVCVRDGVRVRDLPGYEQGEFAVQDHSSMLVASALDPQPGWHVLDLCAAPGGKTTHLAELMRGRGRIVACDVLPERLDTVTSLCQRMRVGIVEPHLITAECPPPAGPFDAALVDVPCSNTGVLGRRPEVRWRVQPEEFEHLIRLQTRLLFDAAERVKAGGVIVYSTCSIEHDECGGVVRAAVRGMRNLRLEAEAMAAPGDPSDGGYWARVRKG